MNSDAVKFFIDGWKARGSERSDAHLFWIGLFRAFGVEEPEKFVLFEVPIDVEGHACFIDGWIPSTRVLIEQKSRGIDLDKSVQQSDGKFLTPYDQAKRYADAMPYSKRPRWIVTCNFDEFRIYDLDRLPSSINDDRTIEPQIIKLKRLVIECRRLRFLVDPNDENIAEVKISKDAVEIIASIRKAFARKMLSPRRVKGDPIDHLTVEQRDQLNQFCVRLVFCLYAEDAALFEPNQFVDYIKAAADQSHALEELFSVLNVPKSDRDPDLRAELRAFPYVNGGLFADASIEVPPFDAIAANAITLEANDSKINWFSINPTIFGALFESDLDPNKRRAGGMHYTSRENIHKLIKPLFLDELQNRFDGIKRKTKNRRRELERFQDEIASLTFLDPACGSGNFLTETYIQLRTLENDVLRELLKYGAICTIKVSIDQFFGIEINGFACAIAQTAMWISESKMFYDTDVGIRDKIEPLPLKHSARIVCGNALRLDWRSIVPDGVDFIIGNPPFVGRKYRSESQRTDMAHVFDGVKGNGNLDFVACWFKLAADFMVDTKTRAAFVATDSICQGIAVPPLWNYIFDNRLHIDFAHRSFRWTSESDDMAAVRCVIVGFSHAPNTRPRLLFDGKKKIIAESINAYLLDAPNIIVGSRAEPLCDVLPMNVGSGPVDDGNLIVSADECDVILRREPRARKYIHPYVGGEEFINGRVRYCLWLKDVTDDDIQSMPMVFRRVEACRQFRLASNRRTTQISAATPHLFAEDRYVAVRSLFMPMVSGGLRRYIPMGFIDADAIANNKSLVVPDADLYHFGVLTSIVHMAWMRVVAARLSTSYSYSATIVYNNFPWCPRTDRIEQTAQSILDTRARYPDRSLASLYNEDTMPDDLRRAHADNDHAVLDAYGFDRALTEDQIVARLMIMYQRLTAH